LTESVSPAELIEAIRTVAKGRPYLGCESTQEALRLLRQQQNGVRVCSGSERLSLQERRIIELMAGGNTNKEIAVKLALSDKAVKNYINKIFVKLEVDRRTEAVARYLQTWQPSLLPDRSMSA
jgi:DNA-binding NarL/FixJ family response regulator